MQIPEGLIDVSVIVPIYNSEKYIKETIIHLMEQSLDNIEYIFINDASIDESLSILNSTLDKYPDRKDRCRIVTHDVNKGIAFSRQEGINMAKGKWVIHCDSDDIPESDAYSRMLEEANKRNADIVICAYDEFYNNGKTISRYQGEGNISAIDVLRAICGNDIKIMHGSLWNKLIKRELWKDVLFPEGLSYCEDVSVLIQILSKNPSVYIMPDFFYHYRVTPGSLCKKKGLKMMANCEILLSFIDSFKGKSGEILQVPLSAFSIHILYRYLINGVDIETLSKKYGSKKYEMNANKHLNLFEREHLLAALSGDKRKASLIGLCNDLMRRFIKKIGIHR